MNNTMKRRAFAALALTAAMAATLPAAHAGRSCESRQPEASNVQRGLDLALRMHQALNASGAQLVMLARAGQDLSKYGLRWSHVGWAYKDGEAWRVVHKLNQCGTPRGDLYRQGLAEFFLDDPFEYRGAYAVPTSEVQRALRALLMDDRRAALAHTPDYSMVAYPWAMRYQQSNQWAIETLALSQLAAIGPRAEANRDLAQAWLVLKHYEPTTLRLGAMTRLGARMTAANVAFDDHPNEKRFSDRIETVTADSVFAWLQRAGLADAPKELQ